MSKPNPKIFLRASTNRNSGPNFYLVPFTHAVYLFCLVTAGNILIRYGAITFQALWLGCLITIQTNFQLLHLLYKLHQLHFFLNIYTAVHAHFSPEILKANTRAAITSSCSRARRSCISTWSPWLKQLMKEPIRRGCWILRTGKDRKKKEKKEKGIYWDFSHYGHVELPHGLWTVCTSHSIVRRMPMRH